jgi:transposase-like protein
MTRRYTAQEKADALKVLEANNGDFSATAKQLGISRETLQRWSLDFREQRIERVRTQITRLHEQLAENALRLAQAMEHKIDDAPLNQVATALNTTVDRYLKIDEHLRTLQSDDQTERKIRIEYKYPDGSIHNRPPWARPDTELRHPLPSGGMWSPLWKDRDGQDSDPGIRDLTGHEVLVAESDLSDGESDLAGFEGGDSRLPQHDH